MSQSKSTRRTFIQRSAGAVGFAMTVPYFSTSSSVRAEDENSKLHVAAIGVGGRGTDIGHQAGRLGKMVVCADVDRKHAERFAEQAKKQYGASCEVVEDYRRILDRKDVDAITCGTPDQWHAKIAIDAMHAGKDVYCEKPLTLTLGESQLISRVTEQTGRIFQVGTQQRSEFGRVFLKAVAIARSGRLGEKLHATSSVGNADAGGPFPTEDPPPNLNFEFWLGQAPLVDFCPNRIGWNFRWWFEYSGGQVTDWGVHHTDIALWALAGENTGIAQAEGEGVFPGLPADTDVIEFLNGRVKLPHQYNVARDFNCHFTLPNGNTINLLSQRNELIIEGEKGRIRVNRGSLTGKPVEEINADPAQRDWLNQEVGKLFRGMPLEGHMANFFHCVKTRQMPISDVWSHCHSVNACHIANVAMLLRRKVTFDPQKYQFVGDEEANRFIHRTQRSPWELTA
jgi:predicted dehydrogenase